MKKISSLLIVAMTILIASCSTPYTGDTSTPTPAVKYTVSYSANSATTGTAPSSVEYEAAAVVTVLGNTGSLAKTAYYFNGWNTAADGSGTAYSAGATFTMPASIVTLYAQWSKSPTYLISYSAPDATGGTIPSDGTGYLSGGSAVVLTGVPTRTDYLFDGWTLSSDGSGTLYKAGDYVTFGDANVTLYAKWLPKHMTLDCYTGCYMWNIVPTASALCFSFASYGTTTGKFVLTTVGGTVYTGSYTDTGAIARTPNSGMKSADTGYTLVFDRGYTATVHLYKTIRISDNAVVYGIFAGRSSVDGKTDLYVSGNETTFDTDWAAIFETATATQWAPYNVKTY